MSEFDQPEIEEKPVGDDGFASMMNSDDVEGVHERRFIKNGTECVLSIDGFTLDTTRGTDLDNVAIVAKYAVKYPDENSDGSSDLICFYGVQTKVKEGNKSSRFEVMRRELFRIVAAALGKRMDDPEVRGFFTPAGGEVDPRDMLGSALPFIVSRMNTLKGKDFPTKIKFQPERDNPSKPGEKWKARQEVGAPQFPGCDERKPRGK